MRDDYEILDWDQGNKSLTSAEGYRSNYSISVKEEKSYCIGRVDLVDSNKIMALVGPSNTAKYYQLFLTSISDIIERFGGSIIKTVEGSMIYYFPESEIRGRRFGFLSCIECGLYLTKIQDKLNRSSVRQGLPKIDYRVSSEYGRVAVIDIEDSGQTDLLGSPMDACAKIIQSCLSNEFVVGKELYEEIKNFDDYCFREQRDCSSENSISYTVTRNKKMEEEHD